MTDSTLQRPRNLQVHKSVRIVLTGGFLMELGKLGGIVVQAIQQAANTAGPGVEVETLQSFSTAYPRPPYRLLTPV